MYYWRGATPLPTPSMKVDTALREDDDGDKRMIGFSEVEDREDERYVRIPRPIVQYMDMHLDMREKGVQVFHDGNGVVTFGAANDGDGQELAWFDGGFWLRMTEETRTFAELDNVTNFPVFLLGCGEVWVVGNDTLWNKLAEGI